MLWIEGQFGEKFASFLIDEVTMPSFWLYSQKLHSSCFLVLSPSFPPLLQTEGMAEKGASRGNPPASWVWPTGSCSGHSEPRGGWRRAKSLSLTGLFFQAGAYRSVD